MWPQLFLHHGFQPIFLLSQALGGFLHISVSAEESFALNCFKGWFPAFCSGIPIPLSSNAKRIKQNEPSVSQVQTDPLPNPLSVNLIAFETKLFTICP